MQRPHDFACSVGSQALPKHAAVHSTSSAFSASANPNEDWTKISDLAERRRIQNRIAQRNYRKKIKRRLEDLERRASSPEGSPEQIHLDLAPSYRLGQRNESTVKRPKLKNNKPIRSTRQISPRHAAPQYAHDSDETTSLFPLQPMRECSISPPPQLSYSYSLSEPSASAPYTPGSSFHPLASGYPDFQGNSYYLPPLPTALPTMPPYELEPMKPGARFAEDGMLNHFSNHAPYPSFGGVEVPQPQQYQDSNIHVNALFYDTHLYWPGY